MQTATNRTVITLGNGQLGLMLGKAAKKLGIPFHAFSLAEAGEWLAQMPDKSHLVTFEQEHVDEALLKALQAYGIESFPTWQSFLLLKSKWSQKKFLAENKIATSPFVSAHPWTAAADDFIRKHNGAILKAGKGGYDGLGVWVVDANGNTKAGPAKDVAAKITDAYLEEKVTFDYELAAVACRSKTGELTAYPSVKSIQRDGVCFQVEYTEEFADTPAAKKASEIARTITEKLGYIGVLAVEFFLRGDEVLVNEIAPRVHNSGHFTIDVCAGSQFENHLRAGLGLPLELTFPTHPAAVMVNLLWPPEEKDFAPLYAKLTCGPDWPVNAKLHWYGKSEIRPRRKMGHFTVYGKTLAECQKIAQEILSTRWA